VSLIERRESDGIWERHHSPALRALQVPSQCSLVVLVEVLLREVDFVMRTDFTACDRNFDINIGIGVCEKFKHSVCTSQ
jgi:hypothetical protein